MRTRFNATSSFLVLLLCGHRGAVPDQQAPQCPTVAIVPFRFEGYGPLGLLRARAESVTVSLNQALQADTTLCWLPVKVEERLQAREGLPPAAHYFVDGSVLTRSPSSAVVVWSLIEVAAGRRLLTDSVSMAEPDWSRRVVQAIAQALGAR
jgi:hypothetical protein